MKLTSIRLPTLSLLVAGLLLSGCPAPGPKPGDQEYTTRQTGIQQAEELLRSAEQANSQQRETAMLQAAELFADEQQLKRAQTTLAGIDPNRLPLRPLADYVLLSAELALQEDNFSVARDLLTNRELERQQLQLPIATQQRWHKQRADVFDLLGEEQNALKEYIALSALLDDNQEIARIHNRLWQTLGRIPQGTVQQLIDKEQDPVRRGWYMLSDLSRSNQGDIHRLQQEIDRWRNDWPDHPATLNPPQALSAIKQIVANLPQHLALLLPLHGNHGTAGATVRDGFMAAYYQVINRQGTPPKLRIYDTSQAENISAVYHNAVNNGAALVIGPLRKENVDALNNLNALPVPVVTLNYLADKSVTPAQNLFQFGLSAADEAREVARRAWLEGHRTAMAIIPQTDLGERALTAFQGEWESRGGTLVVTARYQKSQVDFSEVIKPALLVHQSEQRARQLSRLLGKRLKATPERRRQDLDMVFMQADHVQARQIKPMLDFFYAADLPVYATSQVYSGTVDPGKDRDLEKVKFSAMPWTLPGATLGTTTPESGLHPTYQQLFALGIDAYQIHQSVLQMKVLPETRLFGSTGTLRLDNGRILREQPWAVFRNGKVKPASRNPGP